MLTTAPLCWLVAAHAIWGPTVLDQQNPQHPKQSRVRDWLSQEAWLVSVLPAQARECVHTRVPGPSCQYLSSQESMEFKTLQFLSSAGHRYSLNLNL